MKSFSLLSLLIAGIVCSGCIHFHHRQPAPQPAPAQTSTISTNAEPIVTPATTLEAKVASYNSVGRFVVLSFPIGQMPKTGDTLFLYRAGVKVGEVKITGPQRDNNIVADLVSGDAQVGDDVREQ